MCLKLKSRSVDAPVQSAKFMGHGICDSVSKSLALPAASCQPDVVHAACIELWKAAKIPPADLRGVSRGHISMLLVVAVVVVVVMVVIVVTVTAVVVVAVTDSSVMLVVVVERVVVAVIV